MTSTDTFRDHLTAKRIAQAACHVAYRQLRRSGSTGEAERMRLLSADDVTMFTNSIERKGLAAVCAFGLRAAIRELATHAKIMHLQAEINLRRNRGR